MEAIMKNKQQLARRAVQIFPMRDYADRRAVIHQRKGWARSILKLGKKWILSADRDTAVFLVCLACAPVLFMVPA
jgi:hypothetical protein